MAERKWEKMNVDCLVNILGRVELQTRVQAVPLECKTWYKAVRNPLCWEQLFFPPMLRTPSSQTELIKFVVNRSQRRAIVLGLPYFCDKEALLYVSEELPRLKWLSLSARVCGVHKDIIPSLITKFKNLEGLTLGNAFFVKDILELIPIHFPKFALLDLSNCFVGGETVTAIVTHVPKLKVLIMDQATLDKEDLLLIMRGCKKLKHLNVRNCMGFDEDDEDILRLSSGVKDFQCAGSKVGLQYQLMKRLNTACQSLAQRDVGSIFRAADGVDEFEWDMDEDWADWA